MTDSEFINENLIQLYGKEPNLNLPKYRVVWSDDQTEKRYGKYDLLTQETGIWLGVKEGLVEIKKYWYLEPCWILERVELNINRQDIIYDKFTYEPIYTFLDKDNNRLPLNWRVIQLLVGTIENAEKKVLTEEDHRAEMEKEMDEESKRIYGLLDKPDSTKPLPTFNKSTLSKAVLFRG